MSWQPQRGRVNSVTVDLAQLVVAAICLAMLVGLIGITEKALVALILGSMCEFKATWER